MIDLGREIGMTTKYDEEKRFWKDEISFYVRWFHGRIKELYGVPCPKQHEKVHRFSSEELNAIETWINADKWRYCKRLHVEPTYFSGKKVLEVGSGPLGLSRFFAGAEVHYLDPLHAWYWQCGYPKVGYSIEARIEDCMHHRYDAVISVNAIDHVDQFEDAINACEIMCDMDGEIRNTVDVRWVGPSPHRESRECHRSSPIQRRTSTRAACAVAKIAGGVGGASRRGH